jgi:hypothetical protein
MTVIVDPDAPMLDADPALSEVLNGVPDFLEIPDELREEIEKATMVAERMFWLRSQHIQETPLFTAMLRRAFYAEARAFEMEMRLAETSLIASGLKEKVEELQREIATVAGYTG